VHAQPGRGELPDPDSNGRIQTGLEIDDHSPTVRAAYRACRSLAPSEDSGSAEGDVMSQQQLLAFAKCMRAHAVPAFPDPQVVNDNIRMRVTPGQIDPNSPLVTAAMTACRSKLGANAARGAQKLVQGASARPTGGRTDVHSAYSPPLVTCPRRLPVTKGSLRGHRQIHDGRGRT
jgi:hypothetical protein